MSKVNWLNLELMHRNNVSALVEKSNKKGKYGYRNQIEPLLQRYETKFKEDKKLLNSIKSDLELIKKQVVKSHDNLNERFDTIISRIHEIQNK